MGTLRLIWRIKALLVTTLIGYLLLLLALLLFAPAARLRRWARDRLFRIWARLAARLAGMRVEVEGAPPTGPFFLVCNHLSYMDIVALASRLDAVFVSKAEVRSWPGIGLLARTVGTVFVDRGVRRDLLRANAHIARFLSRGHGIVLFPEGTSTEGATVTPFRPALLELPAQRGLPVHCASISYRTPSGSPPARLAVCWWGDMAFGHHVLDLLRLPRFDARLRFRSGAIAHSDRKRLAAELHRAVSEMFTPVVAAADEPCALADS